MSNKLFSPGQKLSPRQERFVDEYLVDLNAKQAAIRAGYSPKTAKEQGCNLLHLPHVRAAVDEGRKQRSQTVRMNADDLIKRLQDYLDADLADLIDHDGKLRPANQWPEAWRKGLVTGLDIRNVRSKDDETEVASIARIRFADRFRITELLCKLITAAEGAKPKTNLFANVKFKSFIDLVHERHAAQQAERGNKEFAT